MRRETGFLVGAILLHAGLLAVARRIPPPPSWGDWGTVHAIEVELPAEIEPSPPPADNGASSPPSDPATAPTPAAAARVPLGQVIAAPQARSWPVAQPNGEDPVTAPNPEATAQPAPSASGRPQWDGPPDDGRGIVSAPRGLETPLWSRPGMIPDAPTPSAAPTVPPPPRPVDTNIAGKVIMAGLAERDRKLGLELPGAGNVASALAGAVRSSFDVPPVSHASFVVDIGPDGRVQSVRVTGFNGGDAGMWERAAQAANAALKGRALAMNETYAKGATVYVSITSKLQMPDGSKSGVGKLAGAGATFDLSNIGAHATRQVSPSFRVVPR